MTVIDEVENAYGTAMMAWIDGWRKSGGPFADYTEGPSKITVPELRRRFDVLRPHRPDCLTSSRSSSRIGSRSGRPGDESPRAAGAAGASQPRGPCRFRGLAHRRAASDPRARNTGCGDVATCDVTRNTLWHRCSHLQQVSLRRRRPSLAQQLGDGLIPALCGVLVAHRRRWCGVTQPGHQLGDRGARRSRQHGA